MRSPILSLIPCSFRDYLASPARRSLLSNVSRRWRFPGLVMLLVACGLAQAAGLPQGTVVHGPFEIVVGTRGISTGTFPNQGGNPFAKRDVSEYRVMWRGKRVTSPDGSERFWRVLRLEGAPSPTLLLVTKGFVLATEEAGQLKLQPLRAQSNALAEAQWLDSAAGQPGPSVEFGIEAVAELEAGTRLAGGRWLRLGSGVVIDVPALKVYAIEPWVPTKPGVPITSLSRAGDTARAFSPRRSQYVLAASGYDYARNGDMAYGLLVVDIAAGTAYELRVDRRRMRFADTDDFTPEWIAHHFVWQGGTSGTERLAARTGFRPWPWRGRLRQTGSGDAQYEVPRIDARFVAEARRIAAAQPGMEAGAVDANSGFAIRSGGGESCRLSAQAFGRDNPGDDDQRLAIWLDQDSQRKGAVCTAVLKRLAAAIDAELASGRHDGLLRLGE